MFWIAFRYNILYVTKSVVDTDGLLYPAALNQLFAGIYMFEICLIGLFFVTRDARSHWVCLGQAVIMIVTTVLPTGFQILLNRAFGPLLTLRPGIVSNEPSASVGEVSNAFENDALRAHRPTIWIPKDPFGISDNEIFETTESSPELRISNDGARMNLGRRVTIDDDLGKLSALYEKM